MIVGVDVGTSVTKAQLLARDGRTTPAHEARSTVYTLPGNRVEQDMDEVIGTVVTVVRAAVADAAQLDPNEPIEALALTGQGDGLWLRDAQGRPLGRALSWMDGRAADVLDRWTADGITREVHRRTGSGMFPGAAGPLLAHLAEHEPERLAAADVAGYCVDTIAQRFTGQRTVDASDASLPFLNVATRRYDEEALELCGLGRWRHLLAEPAPPGALFGLLPKVAAELGLPPGCPSAPARSTSPPAASAPASARSARATSSSAPPSPARSSAPTPRRPATRRPAWSWPPPTRTATSRSCPP